MGAFDLTDEERAVQTASREFAEKTVRPIVDRFEERHEFPLEIAREMGRLGFFASAFPKTVGGSEIGFLAHALVTEEISRLWSSLRHLFNTQAMTCPYTILKHGTEYQRERFVPKLIGGEWMGLFALTEPEVGSDVAGIRTTARRNGNRYVLNGRKAWISNCTVFDAGVVLARTAADPVGAIQGDRPTGGEHTASPLQDGPSRHQGLSLFIVEKGMTGITATEYRKKMGHHASPTGEIVFDHCEVPETHRIGAEGEGFKIVMDSLNRGRLSVAAGALGVLRACNEVSVEYARTRTQFGKPIGAFQMIQERIADMATLEEASRLLIYKHARTLDRGDDPALTGALAKYHASEAVVKVANWAVEVFGAYGYSEEYPIARLFRDAKMYQIGEGTSNIQRLVIAQRILGFKG